MDLETQTQTDQPDEQPRDILFAMTADEATFVRQAIMAKAFEHHEKSAWAEYHEGPRDAYRALATRLSAARREAGR